MISGLRPAASGSIRGQGAALSQIVSGFWLTKAGTTDHHSILVVYGMYGIVLSEKIRQHFAGATIFTVFLCLFVALMTGFVTLSEQLAHAPQEELEIIVVELLAAIHEKMERLRGLAANRFLGGSYPSERRAMPP